MANAVTPWSQVSGAHGGVPGGGAHQLYKIFDNELVNATADVESVYSSGGRLGLLLGEFSIFGLHVLATGSTPDVSVKLLQSFEDVSASYSVPDVNGTVLTVLDTNPHMVTVSPTPLPWLRFRLDGNAGNSADTRITAYVWMRTS